MNRCPPCSLGLGGAFTRSASVHYSDASLFVLANLALGVVIMVSVLTVLFGILYALSARMVRRYRQSAEMDRELKQLFAEFEQSERLRCAPSLIGSSRRA